MINLKPINEIFTKDEAIEFIKSKDLNKLFGQEVVDIGKNRPSIKNKSLYKSKALRNIKNHTNVRFDDLDLWVIVPDKWLFEKRVIIKD